MIAGRAGLIRAWDARGYGWGSTVTKEGWEVFYRELRKAREELHNAIRLEPKRVNPYMSSLKTISSVNTPNSVNWLPK